MSVHFGGEFHIWLKARHARLGASLMAAIAVLTTLLVTWVIPTPFSFLESTAANVPFNSIAPVATAVAIGYLLGFQNRDLERGTVRRLALFDLALLISLSLILLVPATISLFSHGGNEILAACRSHVFAYWATVTGSYMFGTRLSVIGVTLGILLAPTLLPNHLRQNPPGIFVTLANGNSLESGLITAAFVALGMVLVCLRGLPNRM